MKARRQLAAGLALALTLTSNVASAKPLDQAASRQIEAVTAEEIKSGRSAGIAVGLVVDGRLSFTANRGKANLETGTDVHAKTVFRIASLTKQFTATGILLLAERGRLSLDDRLAKFLPDFPRGGDVTIRQLLSHTAGIHNFTEGSLPVELERAGTTVSAFTQHIASQATVYDFDPGTGFHYSNSGYFLLGAIIEQVSGLSYRAFMDQTLFIPLEMKNTSVDANDDVVVGRASGYIPIAGVAGSYRNAKYVDMTIPYAAGAIRSTVADLAIWVSALHGGKILTPGSLALLTTPVRLADGRTTSEARWIPPGAKRAPQAPPAYRTAADYAFGLEVARFYDQPMISHTGGIAGFNAVLRYFPRQKIATIVLSNTNDGAFRLEEKIARVVIAGRPADMP